MIPISPSGASDKLAIDALMFARLTGTRMGQVYDYIIATDGVRLTDEAAARPELDHIDDSESRALEEYAQDARLIFPTTVVDLMRWTDNQGGNFVLPYWFTEFAAAENFQAAKCVLDNANDATLNELAAREVSRDATANPQFDLVSTDKLEAQRDAIAMIFKTIELQGPAAKESRALHSMQAKVGQRTNPLRDEIELILKRLGADTPTKTVMHELRDNAGKSWSCVIARTPEGLTFRGSDDSNKLLDIEALQKRLKRMKQQMGH